MTDLTPDERSVILRVLNGYRASNLGELKIVEAVRVKLAMPTPAAVTLSIDTLGLSVRAANCLYNAGLVTIGEVATKTDRELLRLKNLGAATLKEIRVAIGAAP